MSVSATAVGENHAAAIRRFVVATLVSVTGDALTLVALPFAVLAAGGTAADVGLAMSARAVSMVVFLLLGGIAGDRLPRTTLLVTSNVLRAGVQLAVGLTLSTAASLPVLLLLQAGHGAASAVYLPTASGLVRQLAGGETVQRVNAALNTAVAVAMTGAPVLAGLLLIWVLPSICIMLDGASFLIAAALLATVPRGRAEADRGAGVLDDLRLGWRSFRSMTWLWAGVLYGGMFHLAVQGTLHVAGPVVAARALGGGPAWGILMGANGVGAIAGSLAASRVRSARPLTVFYRLFVLALPMPIALAFAVPVWAQCPSQAAAGFAIGMGSVLWESTIQRTAPPDQVSRLSAYDWLGSSALRPLGLAAAGPAVDLLGTMPVFLAATAVLAGTTMVMLAWPAAQRVSPSA
ncbi:MAG: MFS transporter [Dactylosporangium sp.]|nr:MFS transporter [Dactylosporangium sp.]NNJ62236.1 MFS transporter [Dactylosporangium sp.]